MTCVPFQIVAMTSQTRSHGLVSALLSPDQARALLCLDPPARLAPTVLSTPTSCLEPGGCRHGTALTQCQQHTTHNLSEAVWYLQVSGVPRSVAVACWVMNCRQLQRCCCCGHCRCRCWSGPFLCSLQPLGSCQVLPRSVVRRSDGLPDGSQFVCSVSPFSWSLQRPVVCSQHFCRRKSQNCPLHSALPSRL